jgi:23S rRNA pseudouridine1911/1915/1917 synthase
MRLDVALVARHPQLSRRQARSAIEGGQVEVDGRVVREAGTPVPESARIDFHPNRPRDKRVRVNLDLLYEDDDVVVVDKPPGLLSVPTHPGATGEDTVVGRLREWAQVRSPRQPYVGLVHRLDRDTSGALAFALTPQSRRALIALVSAHKFERRYSAIVAGEPSEAGGTIDLPLSDAYVSGRRRVARPDDAEKTPAVTRWRVRERFAGAALLEVELETGRQHQIRVHLAAAGMPVLGDEVYAPRGRAIPAATPSRPPTPPLPRAPRQMLHAGHLAFRHPLSGAEIRAVAPLPADFERILRGLRGSNPARKQRSRS